ncbi:hypothetical protein [Microbulbifer sediminum]|uniref:hypothetical protein n=1 Tax=Microbulbifer sediminum TaxID=2904250 RepID=UPI001F16BDC5|nr:hypothetical protein [Microbulbifer sediminum]
MAATEEKKKTGGSQGRKPRKMWLLLLAAGVLAVIFLFHRYQVRQESFLNTYYFHTLQRTVKEFNNKLNQLVLLHTSQENLATIRSIFPSYASKANSDKHVAPDDSGAEEQRGTADKVREPQAGFVISHFVLAGDQVDIYRGDDTTYRVDMDEVLSAPGRDFVLYLVVDGQNRVLGSVGGAAGLSLVDTRAISRKVREIESRSLLKLVSEKGGGAENNASTPLPGHSHYLDIELSAGPARLYIQPFLLHSDVVVRIRMPAEGNGETLQSVGIPGEPLYLIGVLPDKLLDIKEDRRWNLSLLILSLMLLMAFWVVARLLLISPNEPLGRAFYGGTLACTFAAFVMLVALWLAYGEREIATEQKQANARTLLGSISANLETELFWLFRELETFHAYYARLLDLTAQLGEDRSQGNGGLASGQQEDSALLTLPDGCQNFAGGRWRRVTAMVSRDGSGKERPEDIESGETGSAPGWKTFSGPVHCRGCSEPEAELPPLSLTNLYGNGARLLRERPGERAERYLPGEIWQRDGGAKLLTVFLMDHRAWQVLPTFYLIESNNYPRSFNLSHREYFRRVRARQGWSEKFRNRGVAARPEENGRHCMPAPVTEADDNAISEKNFYLQRLLNINTGTRGTTLGVPLKKKAGNGNEPGPSTGDYILGADVLLPSLSLTEWADPRLIQDMVFMVVDRETGDVLFHMDHRRSMVENLFLSGQGTAAVSHRIRAGLFRSASAGYYRGSSGDFVLQKLPISQWVGVVFIPDDSTDSLMTNFFLSITVGIGSVLVLAAFLLYLIPIFMPSHRIKQLLGVPASLNRHNAMLYTSILTAALFVGFRIGSVAQHEYGNSLLWGRAAEAGAALALVACLFWGYRCFLRLARMRDSAVPGNRLYGCGAANLLIIYLCGAVLVIIQLQRVADLPLRGISGWYYERNLYPARLNQELRELQEIAVTRYPNSIERFGADPLELMPLSAEWRDSLACAREELRANKKGVMPEHIGTFSQLTFTTGVASWIERYLLGTASGGKKKGAGSQAGEEKQSDDCRYHEAGLPGDSENSGGKSWLQLLVDIVVLTGVFVLICWLWLLFYRRVITPRMVGTGAMLAHLEHLSQHERGAPDICPDERLVLDLRGNPPPANDLDTLLQRLQRDPAGSLPALERLVSLCPILSQEHSSPGRFPGVRIALQEGAEGISVALSQLDPCLLRAGDRAQLLQLIRQLRAVRGAGELAGLRLYMECHSYETLLLNKRNLASGREPLAAMEMSQWSEELMDFRVVLPARLTSNLDLPFLRYECSATRLLSPLLADLSPSGPAGGDEHCDEWRWRKLYDRDKSGQEWATIHCVLIKAGALFRYHWEACSKAERLALYFLARGRRVNPANTQVLEQLAVQGLIRVEHGKVHIINNSFAYFVRHAESPEGLQQLLASGRESAWMIYRLPVTLLILLLVGVIAVTSGNSLYLIAASLLGLLGTIGSLVSSARMIHENLK